MDMKFFRAILNVLETCEEIIKVLDTQKNSEQNNYSFTNWRSDLNFREPTKQ